MPDNHSTEEQDPAGSTTMFRRFVSDNQQPEEAPRRPVTPYVLAGVGALVAIAIIVAVVMTWS